MSAAPRATAPPAKRATVTLSKLAEKKALGEPIVMVTAYDYPSARRWRIGWRPPGTARWRRWRGSCPRP